MPVIPSTISAVPLPPGPRAPHPGAYPGACPSDGSHCHSLPRTPQPGALMTPPVPPKTFVVPCHELPRPSALPAQPLGAWMGSGHLPAPSLGIWHCLQGNTVL